jgi:hypothetical protein
MSVRWKSALGAALAAAVLSLTPSPAAAQNEHDMTFHTVPPCTVLDTRTAGGAFTAGETRTYNVVGTASLAAQGGSGTGCGVPGFSNSIAQVQAVALNIVALSPAGGGNIAANAADQTMAGSVINFTASQNTANTTPVAVAQTSGVGDFKIQVNISSAHVLVRVYGYYSKPVQTIHVHPVPGDHTASGTALLNAMSGITNASPTKHYVLKLEPGIYDVGGTELAMKDYVDIEGSGQLATIIQGTGNNDDEKLTAVVQGAKSTELRDLQVKSTGSSHLISIAILIPDEDADLRIVDVTAVASGGTGNWAVRNRNGKAVIERSTLQASGGSSAYGVNTKGPGSVTTIKHSVIEASGATSGTFGLGANAFGRYEELRDVQVNVSASSGTAYGIWIHDLPTDEDHRLTDSTITVAGEGQLYGIYSTSYGSLFVEQSQVRTIGSSGVGIQHLTGDTLIDHSEITGASDTVNGSSAFIGATRLNGGGPASGVCAGVYDESFTFYAGPTCP